MREPSMVGTHLALAILHLMLVVRAELGEFPDGAMPSCANAPANTGFRCGPRASHAHPRRDFGVVGRLEHSERILSHGCSEFPCTRGDGESWILEALGLLKPKANFGHFGKAYSVLGTCHQGRSCGILQLPFSWALCRGFVSQLFLRGKKQQQQLP